ncbi:hypothetical protein [Candidatus Nitrosotenuis cloacae]|uniref:hypothetical protein n=1 Tax=Candidatus Nitrosotenuis cloacae TaxID=1603555 RepID=UPI002282E9D1|nr:hypothetical protein [Candidatus Nitrosotenuis cloacae]
MSEPNHAGNIIVNLASLPDFLRKPILKKRMDEFFTLSAPDRIEIINNALAAGPTIPFPNFAKLFGTWLEILAGIDEEKRSGMFSAYLTEIVTNPQKLVLFNLDGILEIFNGLEKPKKDAISNSIRRILAGLTDEQRRRLDLIIPQSAKAALGI